MTTINNQFQRARVIVQSLVQGFDPENGDELPKNSIVNRIEVNRGLSLSVVAMDQVLARLARRAYLPEGVGRAWTKEEEQNLIDEFHGGEPIPLMATKHKRTIRAIEARLEKLGLLRADQRTTDTSFVGNTSEERDDK